jgi:hypothetical protein
MVHATSPTICDCKIVSEDDLVEVNEKGLGFSLRSNKGKQDREVKRVVVLPRSGIEGSHSNPLRAASKKVCLTLSLAAVQAGRPPSLDDLAKTPEWKAEDSYFDPRFPEKNYQ